MATVARAKSATTKVKEQSENEVLVQVDAPTRREFLYYIWGASIVLLLGEATAGIIWFSLPRFAEGTFGGVFSFPPESIPTEGNAPFNEPTGRFWMSNSEEGLTALYNVCTHLGCLPKWVENNSRFECPCHGSKFELSGQYIEGPAPRALDRFRMTILFDDGTEVTTSDSGAPIDIRGRRISSIQVDTGDRINGARNA